MAGLEPSDRIAPHASGPATADATITSSTRLRSRSIDGVQFTEPADADALRGQVEVERATARRHLASVTHSFGDREWRRDHKGDGAYPEDTLWAAAAGFVELDDWINTPPP